MRATAKAERRLPGRASNQIDWAPLRENVIVDSTRRGKKTVAVAFIYTPAVSSNSGRTTLVVEYPLSIGESTTLVVEYPLLLVESCNFITIGMTRKLTPS